LDGAFETSLRERSDAFCVLNIGMTALEWERVGTFAMVHGLPSVSGLRGLVDRGGLMTYGPDIAVIVRRSAAYVDKILKGATPADLPIEQPREFDFVINLKTAQALGLTIPEHVLLQATEVIQ